jgi:hypothetical protein
MSKKGQPFYSDADAFRVITVFDHGDLSSEFYFMSNGWIFSFVFIGITLVEGTVSVETKHSIYGPENY